MAAATSEQISLRSVSSSISCFGLSRATTEITPSDSSSMKRIGNARFSPWSGSGWTIVTSVSVPCRSFDVTLRFAAVAACVSRAAASAGFSALIGNQVV